MPIRTPARSAEPIVAFRGGQRSRARSAFTLLEVMIGSLVLAIVMSTSIAAMDRAFPAVETARNITLAGQILQSEMERLRLQNWATVSALGSGSVTIDPIFTGNPAIGNRFTLTRAVGTPQADMRQITLTISWTGSKGRSYSRSFATRYARYGLYDYLYSTQ